VANEAVLDINDARAPMPRSSRSRQAAPGRTVPLRLPTRLPRGLLKRHRPLCERIPAGRFGSRDAELDPKPTSKRAIAWLQSEQIWAYVPRSLAVSAGLQDRSSIPQLD